MNIISRQSLHCLHRKVKSIYNKPSIRISCFNRNSLRINHSPVSEVYDDYMKHTHRSAQKLSSFFGDEGVPFDITIKEIEASGLKAILQSKVPLCYFLYSLLEDYCSENLFFFMEALHFENNLSLSREEQKESIVGIYNSYLSKRSWLEINIDEKVHSDIHSFIQCIDNNTPQESISKCLKKARNSVYHLMEGSYSKFVKSEGFNEMKKELGTRIYNDNDKLNAVCKLRDYIVKTNENLSQGNSSGSLSSSNNKYHEVITNLVHQFTREVLGVDFDDKGVYPYSLEIDVEKSANLD